ncbi:sigma-70 family RNA polymerase sigma factor [Streptomyces sp. TS71-3]|uniref:sigma-70 family RNA polymerase sigma factor n=1 Tax=Streptomyces sp. TS71-3 TaxID=2733862 RepID=UPI002017E6B9|nr:sigma-70 family RNA polymerase sigma factor [Streptomyces sp. TS71-3]
MLDTAQEDRVRAVLALGGVPHADLPDAVQQIRLRLLERAAKGHEAPRDLSAWAAVVASNPAMDWHRARRRQERLGERLAALRQDASRHEESPEENRVLAPALAQGLDALPDSQRQVVVLRFYADLPVRPHPAHPAGTGARGPGHRRHRGGFGHPGPLGRRRRGCPGGRAGVGTARGGGGAQLFPSGGCGAP